MGWAKAAKAFNALAAKHPADSPERDWAIIHEALADDDDGGHSDEFGIVELHPGRDGAAVIDEHAHPFRLQRRGERLGGLEGRIVLAGRHDVDVGRGDGPPPAGRGRGNGCCDSCCRKRRPMGPGVWSWK